MRILGTLILSLAMAMASAAIAADKPATPKLELPAAQVVEYKAGRLIRIEAKGATKVAWEVVTQPHVELDFAAQGTTLLLPMPPAGTTVLVIAAAVAGDSPAIAKTSVTVKGSVQVSAPVRGRVKHVTIVYETNTATNAQKLAAADRSLRESISARGATLRTVDVADDREEAQAVLEGFRPFYVRLGACIVFQDAGGNVVPATQAFRLDSSDDVAEVARQLVALLDQVNRE